MKIKTFILTFLLMIMSSPIVFGQSRANEIAISNFSALKNAIMEAEGNGPLKLYLTGPGITNANETIIIKDVEVTLDLNGRDLWSAADNYLFQINKDAKLTITNGGNYGEGSIKAKGINVYQGTLELQDVVCTSESKTGALINNQKGSTVIISGGRYVTESNTAINNQGFMTINNAEIRSSYRAITVYKESVLNINNTIIYDENAGYRFDGDNLTAEEINNAYTNTSYTDTSNNPMPVITEGTGTFFVKAEVDTKPFPNLVEAVKDIAKNPVEYTDDPVVDLLCDDILTETVYITDKIEKITINGKGKTLTVGAYSAYPALIPSGFTTGIAFSVKAEETIFKDLTIKADGHTHVLYFRGGADSKMKTAYIDNCNIEGWGAVYVSQVGSEDDPIMIEINESNLVGTNVRNTDLNSEGIEKNSFGTISLNSMANYVTIKMNGGSITAKSDKVNDQDCATQYAIAYSDPAGNANVSSSEFIINADIFPVGNKAKYVGFDGNDNDKDPQAQVLAKYAGDLLDEGWATSAVLDGSGNPTGMISVDGIAVAMIGEQTYSSLEAALEAAVEGDEIKIIANEELTESLKYPTDKDTTPATNITITTADGVEYKPGKQIYFQKGINVTFNNANINAILNSNDNKGDGTSITLTGKNTINVLKSEGGKLVTNGGEQTINTLSGNLNVSNETVLKINNGGTITLNSATLAEGTSLPSTVNIVVEGENNIINQALTVNSFTVNEGATVTVNKKVIACTDKDNQTAEVAINGELIVAENAEFIQEKNKPLNFNNATIVVNKSSEFRAIKPIFSGVNTLEIAGQASFSIGYNPVINEGAEVTLEMYPVVEDGIMISSPTLTTPELSGLKTKTTPGYKIIYKEGAYKVVKNISEYDIVVNTTTNFGYQSLAEALDKVENDQTVVIIGTDKTTEEEGFTYTGTATNFTITANADANYVVKYLNIDNATVNFENIYNTIRALTVGTKDATAETSVANISGNVNIPTISGKGTFNLVEAGKGKNENPTVFTTKNVGANVNASGIIDIVKTEKGDSAGTFYMHNVTLGENTVINDANVVFVGTTDENSTVVEITEDENINVVEITNTVNNSTFNGGTLKVEENVIVNVDGGIINYTSGDQIVNGTLNVSNVNPVFANMKVHGKFTFDKTDDTENSYTFTSNRTYLDVYGNMTFDNVIANVNTVRFLGENSNLEIINSATFNASDKDIDNPSFKISKATTVNVDENSTLNIGSVTVNEDVEAEFNFYGIVTATGNITGTPVINMTKLDDNGQVTDTEQAENVRFYTEQTNLLKDVIVQPKPLYGDDEDWKISHTSEKIGSATKKVYKFSKTNYVAQVGEEKYEKISTAVAATTSENNDNVVTLIKNEIKESISVKTTNKEVIFEVAEGIDAVNITGSMTLDKDVKVEFGTYSTSPAKADGKTINFTGDLTINGTNTVLRITDGYTINVNNVTNSTLIEVYGTLTAEVDVTNDGTMNIWGNLTAKGDVTNNLNMNIWGDLTAEGGVTNISSDSEMNVCGTLKAASITNDGDASMNFEGDSAKEVTPTVIVTGNTKEIYGGNVTFKKVNGFNVNLNQSTSVELSNTTFNADITATIGEGKVTTTGISTIDGDIKAITVTLDGTKAVVTGDITARENVTLNALETSTKNIKITLIGSVRTNGTSKIEGDIENAENVTLGGTKAEVTGTITAFSNVNLSANNTSTEDIIVKSQNGEVKTYTDKNAIINGDIQANKVTFRGNDQYSGNIISDKTTVEETGELTITGESVIPTLDVKGTLNVDNILESTTLNGYGKVNVGTKETDREEVVRKLTANWLNLYNTSTITVNEGAELQFGDLKGYHATVNIEFNGTVVGTGTVVSIPEGTSFYMNAHDATFKTSVNNLVIKTGVTDHKVSYNKDTKTYRLVNKYVAKTGGERYETFAKALEEIEKGTEEETTIELLWEKGDDPIDMQGYVSNINVVVIPAETNTPDEPIIVDWTKGMLFIGRGAETPVFNNDGDATLTFRGIHLDSYHNEEVLSTDIHVSAKSNSNPAAWNGTLKVENSDIQFTYIHDRHLVELINSKVEFTLEKAMNIGGRPGAETNDFQMGTAQFKVDRTSTLKAKNIYMGYEGIGILDVAEGAKVEADNLFVGAHTEGHTTIAVGMGRILSAGDIKGLITPTQDHSKIELRGGIYTDVAAENSDLNDLGWIANGYKAYNIGIKQWQVRQVAGDQVYELNKGWNWFSHYNEEYKSTTGLNEFEVRLGDNASIIKNQTGYRQNLGGGLWVGTLNDLAPESMFMIQTEEAQTIVCNNKPFVDYSNTKIVLNEGWNWIGYPVNETLTIEDALANLTPSKGDIIKGYDNGVVSEYLGVVITNDNGDVITVGWDNPDMELVPGKGYMYYTEEVKEFTYNVPTGSKSATRDNASVAYHWNSEASYPYNMNVIAKVSIDGEVVEDNYEVAAFANGELRGSARPVYVEAFNTYVVYMTIRGDQTEELTFKYYDVNSGKEYKLSNRISYVNDAVIGSTVEPYMLTMSMTDIEEAALSDINIYPNPTTTGVQINLDTRCEKVEIFNALGAKVAEYQNVDTIDALETAGIYVIRLTNNGEIKHTRLVVK